VTVNEVKPWNAMFKCQSCGHRLIPLSYSTSPDNDPRGNDRPALKCPGCSQLYGWKDSVGWVPVKP
jgi:hypothetical protein